MSGIDTSDPGTEAEESPPCNDPPSGDVEVLVWNGLIAYRPCLMRDLEGTSRLRLAEPGTGGTEVALSSGRR